MDLVKGGSAEEYSLAILKHRIFTIHQFGVRNREFHAEVSKLLRIMLVFATAIDVKTAVHRLIEFAPAHKNRGLSANPSTINWRLHLNATVSGSFG